MKGLRSLKYFKWDIKPDSSFAMRRGGSTAETLCVSSAAMTTSDEGRLAPRSQAERGNEKPAVHYLSGTGMIRSSKRPPSRTRKRLLTARVDKALPASGKPDSDATLPDALAAVPS